MYKYQMETINQIKDCAEKLEKITQEKYSLTIGTITDEFWNGTNWTTKEGDLQLLLNHENNRFCIIGDFGLEIATLVDIDDGAKINLEQNVFLKLNNLVDKVYNDNTKRKQFHESLNKQLESLNNILDQM